MVELKLVLVMDEAAGFRLYDMAEDLGMTTHEFLRDALQNAITSHEVRMSTACSLAATCLTAVLRGGDAVP